MVKGEFFVTTPIYYINDVPHIGHAYTTIAADILARWERLKGSDVFFLTGTDENSVKTVQAARKAGEKDIGKYTDRMAARWQETWRKLGISNDDFIRTTEERHKKFVAEFFNKINKSGDLYKGKYEGLYCEGCEAFYTEKDLVKGRCPVHKTEPKKLIEENYFFRLSKYQEKLIEHIEKNPGFVQPESRRNEVLSFVKEGLRDVSVSRPGQEWGIEFPLDKSHRFWVWAEALLNYISADPKRWAADMLLIGKDIIRFHCMVFPALLWSAGYPLPKSIFVHGYFTVDGEKMSKSLGNVVDPVKISEKYSRDALRYYLMREIPFGEDGDFSEKILIERINGERVSD
ncbi:MAG: methionine--tRNA ligase, partial [Candidatus Aenigmarchaeota archaeon]|nr:methionine--tRNA ligase [Candidatus Aenigmarchaeota archaeon]